MCANKGLQHQTMLHLSSPAPQQSCTCWVNHGDSVFLFSCSGENKRLRVQKANSSKKKNANEAQQVNPVVLHIHIDIRATSPGALPQSQEISDICACVKTSNTYSVPIDPWFWKLVHTTTALGLRSSCCLHEVGPRPWSKMHTQCFKQHLRYCAML